MDRRDASRRYRGALSMSDKGEYLYFRQCQYPFGEEILKSQIKQTKNPACQETNQLTYLTIDKQKPSKSLVLIIII